MKKPRGRRARAAAERSLALVVVLGAVGGQVDPLAHENSTPIHHVASGGRDEGDCADGSYPCLTIPYALAKADKGDEIRVAGGFFDFRPQDPAEAIQLLSPVIPVRGSFDAGFVEQNVADTPTILRGPHASYLPALEQRGLLVARDGPASPGVATQMATRRSPSSPGAVRHAIPGGRNADDCTRDAPCALDSALAAAESGDTVLIAGGDYRIGPDAVADLMRADIMVRGGYLEAWGFAAAAPTVRPSYVTGPGFEHRKALAARGLTLVHDRKALAFGELTDAGGPTRRGDTVQGPTPCDSGTGLAGTFPCNGIDLLAHMPLGAFSSAPGSANDVWGFADRRDNREYAVIGLSNGTAVVDVTDPSDPREVGTIGGHDASWRDVKVYQRVGEDGNWQAYAYVTADFPGERQGLQIIDLSGLPDSISLAATYRGFSRAHNLQISNVNPSTGVALPGREPLAFILGSDKGNGAPHALSLQDPLAPVEVVPALMVDGDAAGARYTHDAAAAVIDDSRAAACLSGDDPPAGGHLPCEVLLDFAEDRLLLWDVTDRSAPMLLSSTTYADIGYAHSGWWSPDTRFVFVHDEEDEQDQQRNTTLRIFDMGDLTAPVLAGVWTGSEQSTDHNGYAVGDRYYMSAYRRGLIVLDIADPDDPEEIAFFDTLPSPVSNGPDFTGAWGVYPFLPSGTLLVSNIGEGLFVLEPSPSNRSPEVVGTLPARSVRVADGAQTVEVSRAFRDPDDDALTYGASSSAVTVAAATATGSTVTVTPLSPGTSTVTVTATDVEGSNTSATHRFVVRVTGGPEPPGGGGGGGRVLRRPARSREHPGAHLGRRR